ncbi:hypothetical protein QJS10_CPB17g02073 [Acorus calamus]|uniref:Uncharacterized protein n=1 Tax=Acorus calamus TaxID=4465 RepID=A0AAV9CUJ6_ACOCL|nr:hypothetical protein QJS10_CPB17g02073 [Acorus calamus]
MQEIKFSNASSYERKSHRGGKWDFTSNRFNRSSRLGRSGAQKSFISTSSYSKVKPLCEDVGFD